MDTHTMHEFFANRTLPQDMLDRLMETEGRLRAAHKSHIGFPYNLSFGPSLPATLQRFLINNLGDPYTGSHYASDVCEMERDAITWLMRLWGCHNLDDYWGSIGASGTEGNIWGIYLGREALPDAILLHSDDVHYSVPKAARLQRIQSCGLRSTPEGALDLAALDEKLRALKGRPVILVLTCGTTMKGAHDDIAGAIGLLGAAGYGRDTSYVHVDGALNAMVIPFLPDAPNGIRPMFDVGIDSVSTSGHKMIGTPMPCGALVARKAHVERISNVISYLKSNDTTLMGSRNGHAVLAIWARLFGHGYGGYAHDALSNTIRAAGLAKRLAATGAGVLCNPQSLTVVFDEPEAKIVQKYQLACDKGRAHAIVMPSVTDDLLDQFATDFLNWHRWSGKADQLCGAAVTAV